MNSTAIATTAAKGFAMMLEQARKSLDAHRTSVVPVDKIVAGAKMVAAQNPGLYDCTPQSVMVAIYQSARLGLEVGGPLGHSYVIPFKRQATLIIGYRGLIELAMRSGHLSAVIGRVVRDGDRFDVVQGTDESITHVPLNLDNSRPPVAFYAVAQLPGGGRLFEVMSKEQVDVIRAGSKSGNDGPWVTDYERMGVKTAIRRLCTVLPMSPELAAGLEVIDREQQSHAPTKSEIVDIDFEVVTAPVGATP